MNVLNYIGNVFKTWVGMYLLMFFITVPAVAVYHTLKWMGVL